MPLHHPALAARIKRFQRTHNIIIISVVVRQRQRLVRGDLLLLQLLCGYSARCLRKKKLIFLFGEFLHDAFNCCGDMFGGSGGARRCTASCSETIQVSLVNHFLKSLR